MASGDSITTHYKGALSVVPGVLAGREHYPCRKFPLNSCKSLLFHGGDTGSIPVRKIPVSPRGGKSEMTLNLRLRDALARRNRVPLRERERCRQQCRQLITIIYR